MIDVTHGIAPQAVLQGALVLRATDAGTCRSGVHLAVVDPGVGGSRRAVAVRTADGRVFVGPDNGLLMLAADDAGVAAAHELADPRVPPARGLAHLPRPRRVRAGRRASRGRASPSAELGPPVDPATLVRVAVPSPEVGRAQISRDRALRRPVRQRRHSTRTGRTSTRSELADGDRVEIRLALDRYYALVAETFADAGAAAS